MLIAVESFTIKSQRILLEIIVLLFLYNIIESVEHIKKSSSGKMLQIPCKEYDNSQRLVRRDCFAVKTF